MSRDVTVVDLWRSLDVRIERIEEALIALASEPRPTSDAVRSFLRPPETP